MKLIHSKLHPTYYSWASYCKLCPGHYARPSLACLFMVWSSYSWRYCSYSKWCKRIDETTLGLASRWSKIRSPRRVCHRIALVTAVDTVNGCIWDKKNIFKELNPGRLNRVAMCTSNTECHQSTEPRLSSLICTDLCTWNCRLRIRAFRPAIISIVMKWRLTLGILFGLVVTLSSRNCKLDNCWSMMTWRHPLEQVCQYITFTLKAFKTIQN